MKIYLNGYGYIDRATLIQCEKHMKHKEEKFEIARDLGMLEYDTIISVMARQYHLYKNSISQIANIFNVTPSTIYNLFNKIGIRILNNRNRYLTPIEAKDCLESKESAEALGRKYGCPGIVIRQIRLGRTYKNISRK